MMKLQKMTLVTLLALNASAAVEITEEKLVNWAKSDSFRTQMIALDNLSKKAELSQFNDRFNFSADASFNYAKTDETAFSANMPITSPSSAAEITISKPTKYGVAASVSTSTSQISNSFFKDGTTSAIGAGLSIDLYKDLLGRTTRTQEKSLKLKNTISEKEREITNHTYVQEVRKIYWKLVANNESLKIARNLLKTAQRLEQDTIKRLKNNIADKGALARTQSQVQARNGQILLLEFERSQLLQSLKSLFPEQLGNQKIQLTNYNLDTTIKNVLACTGKIQSQTEIPNDFTLYDDILKLLREDLQASKKVNDTYSMADLKLVSDVKYVGKDFSYSDSFDQLKDEKRKSYSVGLQISIPLGGNKKSTEAIQDEILQKQHISKYQEIEGKLEAFHNQTIKSIGILNRVIAAQQLNSRYLKESLKDSNKKFAQARLSARDLIQDEDAYLQSNLDEINTKYNVIQTLVDYFTVFSETPCEINIK